MKIHPLVSLLLVAAFLQGCAADPAAPSSSAAGSTSAGSDSFASPASQAAASSAPTEPSAASASSVPAGYAEHVVVFPAGGGETARKAADPSISAFSVAFLLPDGWELTPASPPPPGERELHYLYDSAWGIQEIFRDMDCVGAVGCRSYELYEGAEDLPQAIYSQIALGNGYKFDARNAYREVNVTDSECTAVTEVLYSAAFMEGMGFNRIARTNRGILSYNRERLVYIAMEFDWLEVDAETVETIAKSVRFLDPPEGAESTSWPAD